MIFVSVSSSSLPGALFFLISLFFTSGSCTFLYPVSIQDVGKRIR
jgi:hypothetical protein